MAKLEGTVATFTATNDSLTRQLAESAAALAKSEARATDAQERLIVVESEVTSARALLSEAEGALERFDARLAHRYSPRGGQANFRDSHGQLGAWVGKGAGKLALKARALRAMKNGKKNAGAENRR